MMTLAKCKGCKTTWHDGIGYCPTCGSTEFELVGDKKAENKNDRDSEPRPDKPVE